MNRFLAGLVTGLIITLTVTAWAAAPITLVVNGRTVESNPPPQIIGDRVFVPVRFVAEALGQSVIWDDSSRTVSIGYAPITEEDHLPAGDGVATTITVAASAIPGTSHRIEMVFEPADIAKVKYAFDHARLDISYPAGTEPASQHLIITDLNGSGRIAFVWDIPSNAVPGPAVARISTYRSNNQPLFWYTAHFNVVARVR